VLDWQRQRILACTFIMLLPDAELKASHGAPCIVALAHSHDARTDEVELKARLDAARYFLLPPPHPNPMAGRCNKAQTTSIAQCFYRWRRGCC
jgi:hypothetical protein